MERSPSMRPSAATVARRYLPLTVVVVVQLLLVALAPSQPITRDAPGPGDVAEASVGPPVAVDTGAGDISDAAAQDASPSLSSSGDAAAGRTASSTSTASPEPTTPPASTSRPRGSTAHCVAGRQFDPRIDFYAPPCTPRFTGTNPGATAQGVTAEEILLIDYLVSPGPGPSTFLLAQDLAASPDDQARFDEVAAKFINEHFELYGRTVRIETWQSSCNTQPPDESCFRADAAQLVADKKPFAVVNSTVFPMSFLFDELSHRHTVNVGGFQYRDEFSAARRPYHWDPNISGTRMAEIFAEWYCKQLHGRPVQYAGQPRQPAESFNGKPRVLGLIALNDAENKAVVRSVLQPALARCGAEIAHTYFVEPNVQRASEQNQAGIATLRQSPESTVVLCICGPGMALTHEAMQRENYYPENLMPGNSLTDLDSVAQFFTGALGCPTRMNCQAENMFGLAQLAPQEPRFQGVGSRIWRAAGNSGDPPYARVDLDWTYWSMLASMIQAAGPDLTPITLERGAFALPGVGGGSSGYALRQFGSGSHSWVHDMRAVYWSMTKPSRYNGAAGTWVQIGDGRFELGSVPQGPLLLPPKPR